MNRIGVSAGLTFLKLGGEGSSGGSRRAVRWYGPCKGGASAGEDGEGYCEASHRGPLCEVCTEERRHFDRRVARCVACPPAAELVASAAALLAVLLLAGGCVLFHRRPLRALRRLQRVRRNEVAPLGVHRHALTAQSSVVNQWSINQKIR